MADLKTRTPRSPGPAGPAARRRAARAATALRGHARAGLRTAARTAAPAALWREHRLMTIAVLLGLVPRILALLAFRPALLTADSFVYMSSAVTHTLGTIRPSGYSLFLALARVLPRPLLAVTVLQHLMGLAVAVIVYALLRSRGLPGWGATLAALPTLFDVREIALESYILPDTLFGVVLIIVVALLLTRRPPSGWQCAAAGLLLAYACVLRGNGLPLAVVAGLFLLIRRVGWKALGAAAAAFAVPLLGYVAAFHAAYGSYNLTASDGLFLWSRTTSFANCTIIHPAPQLVPLCPGRAKGIAVPAPAAWSVPHLLAAPTPSGLPVVGRRVVAARRAAGRRHLQQPPRPAVRGGRHHGPAPGLPARGRPGRAADLRGHRPVTGRQRDDLHAGRPHRRPAGLLPG